MIVDWWNLWFACVNCLYMQFSVPVKRCKCFHLLPFLLTFVMPWLSPGFKIGMLNFMCIFFRTSYLAWLHSHDSPWLWWQLKASLKNLLNVLLNFWKHYCYVFTAALKILMCDIFKYYYSNIAYKSIVFIFDSSTPAYHWKGEGDYLLNGRNNIMNFGTHLYCAIIQLCMNW